MIKQRSFTLVLILFIVTLFGVQVYPESVKIGLNYPETGPYAAIGLDQLRAAQLAVEEINRSGGIMGKQVDLMTRNTFSNKYKARKSAEAMIFEGATMIFGGVDSRVSVSVSGICQDYNTLYMACIAPSNDTTGIRAHRHTFSASHNSWMGARALGAYLTKNHMGKKYFYITSDYYWGWRTEEALRKFTLTDDRGVHQQQLTLRGTRNFKKALFLAKRAKPDILVFVQFGNELVAAMRQATEMGLKKTTTFVAPIMELSLLESAGPELAEGVLGISDWNWQVPYEYNYEKGKQFVDRFVRKFKRYPCWGAATAYTNVMEYKSAVERAESFDHEKVVQALEGHTFTLLKNEQEWRDFDHQNIQDVYIVQGRKKSEVLNNRLKQAYFHILGRAPGKGIVKTREEWESLRKIEGLPVHLESLDYPPPPRFLRETPGGPFRTSGSIPDL